MIENKGKEDFNEIIALYFDIDIKLIQGRIQFLNLIVFAIFYIGFRTILSSSKTNFAKIVDLIKDDPIFPNNSLLSQYSVEIQVIVTLNHLGCDGNGASIGALGRIYSRYFHWNCDNKLHQQSCLLGLVQPSRPDNFLAL